MIHRTSALLFVMLIFIVTMNPRNVFCGSRDVMSPVDGEKQIYGKAPDFALKDTSGRTVSFSSVKGKVVLLNFWATWCPPCKAEMPSMNRLYNSMKVRGLEIIAVSSDSSLSGIKDFLAKSRVDFLVLHDEKKAVSLQYKVFSMPTTFLIDRNGSIVEKFYGEYDWTAPEVRSRIEKLL
jgi:peroxiredoxin